MKRREFLKSMTALAAGSVLPAAPAVWSPAKAQSRQETLLVVTESGPNNFDIHGVGTNRPGYEVSWNCYDRLISRTARRRCRRHAVLRPRQVHARARRGLERRRHVGHLQAAQERDLPRRHADHRQGREVVVRPRRHGRRLPDLPDEGRLAREARAVRRRRRPHLPRRLHPQGQADDARSRGRSCRRSINSELVKKHATEKDPWGLEYTKTNIAGGGAYKVARWQAGTEVVFERNDDWKSGPLPKVQARRLAHRAVGRQPARADRARRRRHLLRSAEQGFRRAQAGRQGQRRLDADRQRHPVSSA